MARKIRIKGYRRKGFVKDVKPGPGVRRKRIKATGVRGHMRKDLGKPGRTPKSERWFKPKRGLGWEKDMPQEKRIRVAIASRPSNWSQKKRVLSASRALQALANITTDKETERLAEKDALVLRRRL